MSTRDSSWLREALATRDIEQVKANMAAAGERINDARSHVRSARRLADDDRTLAMSACHDAIRKSITAHMALAGFRPRGGEGAHRIVLADARDQLADVIEPTDLDEADDIRKDRGLAEYGDFASRQLTPSRIEVAAEVAERIVNAVGPRSRPRSRLGDEEPFDRRRRTTRHGTVWPVSWWPGPASIR